MKKILITIIILLATIVSFNAGSASAYNPLTPCPSGNCTNACPPGSTVAVCSDAANQTNATTNPVVDVITTAAKIVSIIIGFASVALIIISGVTLITSGGNPEAVKSSRGRIIGAVVGLVVAALAWSLATYVLTKL